MRIIDPHNDLLPGGLLAQLVEHAAPAWQRSGSIPRSGLSRCYSSSAKMRWSNSFITFQRNSSIGYHYMVCIGKTKCIRWRGPSDIHCLARSWFSIRCLPCSCSRNACCSFVVHFVFLYGNFARTWQWGESYFFALWTEKGFALPFDPRNTQLPEILTRENSKSFFFVLFFQRMKYFMSSPCRLVELDLANYFILHCSL